MRSRSYTCSRYTSDTYWPISVLDFDTRKYVYLSTVYVTLIDTYHIILLENLEYNIFFIFIYTIVITNFFATWTFNWFAFLRRYHRRALVILLLLLLCLYCIIIFIDLKILNYYTIALITLLFVFILYMHYNISIPTDMREKYRESCYNSSKNDGDTL